MRFVSADISMAWHKCVFYSHWNCLLLLSATFRHFLVKMQTQCIFIPFQQRDRPLFRVAASTQPLSGSRDGAMGMAKLPPFRKLEPKGKGKAYVDGWITWNSAAFPETISFPSHAGASESPRAPDTGCEEKGFFIFSILRPCLYKLFLKFSCLQGSFLGKVCFC